MSDKKRRVVIIHSNGAVTVADGKIPRSAGSSDVGTPYDLDGAFSKGALISKEAIPIGTQGSSLMLVIEEK
jgi:hypothetical protein